MCTYRTADGQFYREKGRNDRTSAKEERQRDIAADESRGCAQPSFLVVKLSLCVSVCLYVRCAQLSRVCSIAPLPWPRLLSRLIDNWKKRNTKRQLQNDRVIPSPAAFFASLFLRLLADCSTIFLIFSLPLPFVRSGL